MIKKVCLSKVRFNRHRHIRIFLDEKFIHIHKNFWFRSQLPSDDEIVFLFVRNHAWSITSSQTKYHNSKGRNNRTQLCLFQPFPQIGHDPEKVYEVARDGIAKQDQLAFLKPMAYQNTYAIAVPKKIAQEYGLKTISDLKKVEGQLKAGFTLEFNDREDGNKGLQSVYGLNLNVATMEPALRYQAIQSGDIQITDAYSTDAEIARYDLMILEDDQHLFPPYQGAPLMKQELLKKHPELEAVLNQLAGKITESQMSQMNYQVGVEGKSAEQVAKEFLQEQGLLKK